MYEEVECMELQNDLVDTNMTSWVWHAQTYIFYSYDISVLKWLTPISITIGYVTLETIPHIHNDYGDCLTVICPLLSEWVSEAECQTETP